MIDDDCPAHKDACGAGVASPERSETVTSVAASSRVDNHGMVNVTRIEALALIALGCGCGKNTDATEKTQTTASDPSPRAPAARALPAAPRHYDDSTDGLHRLFSDGFAAMRANDGAAMQALETGLDLDRPEDWFNTTFGPVTGARLAVDYGKGSIGPGMLATTLKTALDAGRTSVVVSKFVNPGDPEANTYEDQVLIAMKAKRPIYSVRLVPPGKVNGMHLFVFVYDQGFKFLGPLKHAKSAQSNDETMDAVASLMNKDRIAYFKTGALPDD